MQFKTKPDKLRFRFKKVPWLHDTIPIMQFQSRADKLQAQATT